MNRKNRSKLMSFLIVMLISIMSTASFVSASDSVDPDRTGSISVKFQYQGELSDYGSLVIYRVADLVSDDGKWNYSLTDSFSESKISLEEPIDGEKAQKLLDYAGNEKVSGQELSISKDGSAGAEDLKTGLYLVAQKRAASGYYDIKPFLIGLPYQESGTIEYQVDASPKLEYQKKDGSKPDDNKPVSPTPTPTAKPKPTGKIPQTGQLNWPIPILAGLGILFCILGSLERKRAGEL